MRSSPRRFGNSIGGPTAHLLRDPCHLEAISRVTLGSTSNQVEGFLSRLSAADDFGVMLAIVFLRNPKHTMLGVSEGAASHIPI